ncbi:MAG TPA: 23S rRNA (uracil(1939)-C(5))-methyltransferase RlmD [Terriglobales bacterium]|nr:23S rRNA (uracil(1939)-C(5))-methyltransferase RlmD [Terriglobales bacterium]
MLLTIEKLIYGGDGLARLPADERGRGKAVFVPFVLPGEQIEANLTEQKPGFARARLESILQASPQRIAPQCPYFERCGGCHYQHIPYEQQLEIKAAILKENLRRIAKIELESELKIHSSPPWNYRNRARFRIQATPEFALGYFRFGSHELLAVEQCPISSPLINRAIGELWQLGRDGKIEGAVQEIELFANAEETELLAEIYCASETTSAVAAAIAEKLQISHLSGVVVFRSVGGSYASTAEPQRLFSSGAESLAYSTQHASYRVSAGAFFQVNRHLVGELAEIVAANLSGRFALDLFAGGGLFSLLLARSFPQVIAVEASQTAHADLLYNAPGNVKVVRAMADHYLKNAGRTLRPDFVVVDPPRSGLGESVVRALAASGAPRITYVSCDPATLARDLGGLLRAGYRIDQAHLVDLFPQTFHLESVVQLVRN